MWGQRILSKKWSSHWKNVEPLDPGEVTTEKVIILLTDGRPYWPTGNEPEDKVLGRFGVYGYMANNFLDVTDPFSEKHRAAALMKKYKAACEYIKDDGIKLITIGYNLTNKNAKFLEACASSPSDYYAAPGKIELETAIDDILQKLNVNEPRLVR